MTIKEHNGRCIGRNGIFEQWHDNTTGEIVTFAVFPVKNGRMTNPVTEVTYDECGNKTEWEAYYKLPPFWEERVEIGVTSIGIAQLNQVDDPYVVKRPWWMSPDEACSLQFPLPEPTRPYWWTTGKAWLLALIVTVDVLLFLLWWLSA